MKLIETLRADRIQAFKTKERIKLNLLGCVVTEACKEVKEPEDSKVLQTIKKFIDNAKFNIETIDPKEYEHYKATIELEILEGYRPKQMTEKDIESIILLKKAEFDNIKSMMQYFKVNYTGQYDGKLVSDLVKTLM